MIDVKVTIHQITDPHWNNGKVGRWCIMLPVLSVLHGAQPPIEAELATYLNTLDLELYISPNPVTDGFLVHAVNLGRSVMHWRVVGGKLIGDKVVVHTYLPVRLMAWCNEGKPVMIFELYEPFGSDFEMRWE